MAKDGEERKGPLAKCNRDPERTGAHSLRGVRSEAYPGDLPWFREKILVIPLTGTCPAGSLPTGRQEGGTI